MSETEKKAVLIREEIEKLNKKRFNLAMVDHWDDECYALDKGWLNRITELENELKELEGV